jgi:hypothetical protein
MDRQDYLSNHYAVSISCALDPPRPPRILNPEAKRLVLFKHRRFLTKNII